MFAFCVVIVIDDHTKPTIIRNLQSYETYKSTKYLRQTLYNNFLVK